MVRVKGEPLVAVKYKNGVIDRIPSAKMSAQQILARLRDRSAELEAEEFLQKSGAAGQQLESGWGSGDDSVQSGIAIKIQNIEIQYLREASTSNEAGPGLPEHQSAAL
ncbi:hypothetical protein WJX74_004005 [Apatococcus lobatus]|uniref:Uncharacterized protein n=2 Tax=Apatococcus TaxID=904362 RepID=A0AAW1SPC8_9CHLO